MKTDLEFKIKSYNATRIYMRKRNSKAKIKLFNILGGAKCKKCGFSDMRALQIDHIKGDGHDFNRLEHRYPYEFLLKTPNIQESLQVLCANCNWIKRDENNESRGKVYNEHKTKS